MTWELLGWWGWQHMSWQQIQNMKRNMKKVPIIQEKSKAQHQKDSIDAEIKFLDSLEKLPERKVVKIEKQTYETEEKLNILQKLVKYVKTLINKLF